MLQSTTECILICIYTFCVCTCVTSLKFFHVANAWIKDFFFLESCYSGNVVHVVLCVLLRVYTYNVRVFSVFLSVNICPEDGVVDRSCFNEAQQFVYDLIENQ